MNKINEIQKIDVFEQYEAAKDIINSFLTSYKNQNSWKIRLLDSYVIFCFIVFAVTFVYVILNGLFPMNAILASLICSLGSMILAVSLRFQINPTSKTDKYSNEKAFAEYLFGSLILYFVCINYLG